MILLCTAAFAGSFVVVVREEDHAFSGAIPRLTVTDDAGTAAQVDLNDNGSNPDLKAGDSVWSGGNAALSGGKLSVLLTDGGDHRVWKGVFQPVAGDPQVLSLSAAAAGVITQLEASDLAFGTLAAGDPGPEDPAPASAPNGQPAAASPEPSPPQAAPGEPSGAAPPSGTEGKAAAAGGRSVAASSSTAPTLDPFSVLGAPARVAAWGFVAAAIAWVLAGSRRFTPAAIEPLPGAVPTLEGRGIVPMGGDWAAFVRTLAGPFRVILLGASDPGTVPGGTVFVLGPGRAAVDDVVAMLAHLDHSGPPVVVVLLGEVEAAGGLAGEAALLELARKLPSSAVVYAFPAIAG